MRADLVAVSANHVAFFDFSPDFFGIVSCSPRDVEQLLCAWTVVKLKSDVMSVVAAISATVLQLVDP